jgi:hypothetical protein
MNKLEAIEYLLENGYRGSEWQEAGLLHAVEKVINGECELDSKSLQIEIKVAGNF